MIAEAGLAALWLAAALALLQLVLAFGPAPLRNGSAPLRSVNPRRPCAARETHEAPRAGNA